MRVEGELAERARGLAEKLLIAVLVAMVVVSLWTALSWERISDRWFAFPNILYLSPVPIITAAVAYLAWRKLRTGSDAIPFVASIGLFVLGFIGLAVSNLPVLVPPSVTIWEAAAVPSSQLFMLVGAVALLPLIFGYTAFVYYTFRGKVRPGEGYH